MARSYNRDPYRWLFPTDRDRDVLQAVPVVTSGGIVAGDTLALEVHAGAGAKLAVVGQAAEKIYRSDGPVAETKVTLNAGPGTWLEWIPQGTILFDGARVRRRIDIELDETAQLMAGELIYFGRRAMGERFATGLADETWTVTVAGRPVWTDRLRIDGGDRLDDPFGFDGAVAYGTLLFAGAGVADALDWARALLPESTEDLRIGVTALDGLMVCRLFGRDGAAVRDRFASIWAAWRNRFGGHAARMPRLWDI